MELSYLQKKRIVPRVPSADVLRQANEGQKFIVVEDDFEQQFVPLGYTLIDLKYKGDSFKTLVPQRLLFFMANPGEGDSINALDDIADFYGNVKEYEDELIGEGARSVQGADWAMMARESYQTYLINKLVKPNSADDGKPEFDPRILEHIGLTDSYVQERVKAIAALTLGKKGEELVQYGLNDILEFKRVSEVAPVTQDEFRKITTHKYVNHWDRHAKTMRCLGDSHYYLKDEYMNNPDCDYDLRTMTKTVIKLRDPALNKTIAEILDEIEQHRKQKKEPIERHDQALLRQYINLAYLAKENPRLQLDVSPPTKNNEEKITGQPPEKITEQR